MGISHRIRMSVIALAATAALVGAAFMIPVGQIYRISS